jgi:hypothetical protein
MCSYEIWYEKFPDRTLAFSYVNLHKEWPRTPIAYLLLLLSENSRNIKKKRSNTGFLMKTNLTQCQTIARSCGSLAETEHRSLVLGSLQPELLDKGV